MRTSKALTASERPRARSAASKLHDCTQHTRLLKVWRTHVPPVTHPRQGTSAALHVKCLSLWQLLQRFTTATSGVFHVRCCEVFPHVCCWLLWHKNDQKNSSNTWKSGVRSAAWLLLTQGGQKNWNSGGMWRRTFNQVLCLLLYTNTQYNSSIFQGQLCTFHSS